MEIIGLLTGAWIALWALILLLAIRDALDAVVDLDVARTMRRKRYRVLALRAVELTLGMVIMAALSLLLGLLAALTPLLADVFGTPLFRVISSAIFVLGAAFVLALKWMALRNRYQLLRRDGDTMLRWALYFALGRSRRLTEVDPLRDEQTEGSAYEDAE